MKNITAFINEQFEADTDLLNVSEEIDEGLFDKIKGLFSSEVKDEKQLRKQIDKAKDNPEKVVQAYGKLVASMGLIGKGGKFNVATIEHNVGMLKKQQDKQIDVIFNGLMTYETIKAIDKPSSALIKAKKTLKDVLSVFKKEYSDAWAEVAPSFEQLEKDVEGLPEDVKNEINNIKTAIKQAKNKEQADAIKQALQQQLDELNGQ